MLWKKWWLYKILKDTNDTELSVGPNINIFTYIWPPTSIDLSTNKLTFLPYCLEGKLLRVKSDQFWAFSSLGSSCKAQNKGFSIIFFLKYLAQSFKNIMSKFHQNRTWRASSAPIWRHFTSLIIYCVVYIILYIYRKWQVMNRCFWTYSLHISRHNFQNIGKRRSDIWSLQR